MIGSSLRWVGVIVAVSLCGAVALQASEAHYSSRDPFHSLVAAPEPVATAPDENKVQPPVSTSPVIPPLMVKVAGYASEGDHSLAILEYQSERFLAEEGWESEDGAFEVQKVERPQGGDVRVQIYDRRTQRRHLIEFGEGTASAPSAPRPLRCGVTR